MVVDNIKNAGLYFGLGTRIKKALKYLQETDFTRMVPGKYKIDGRSIYALVQEYDTKLPEEGLWEAHRRYIDIQYVADGMEQIGYAFIEDLEVIKEYDIGGDCLFLKGRGSMVLCPAGTFAIFKPEDAHMPCMAAEVPSRVKKVVVKVKV
jgi:YhcH/YjgK/YiaL family protein